MTLTIAVNSFQHRIKEIDDILENLKLQIGYLEQTCEELHQRVTMLEEIEEERQIMNTAFIDDSCSEIDDEISEEVDSLRIN